MNWSHYHKPPNIRVPPYPAGSQTFGAVRAISISASRYASQLPAYLTTVILRNNAQYEPFAPLEMSFEWSCLLQTLVRDCFSIAEKKKEQFDNRLNESE